MCSKKMKNLVYGNKIEDSHRNRCIKLLHTKFIYFDDPLLDTTVENISKSVCIITI